MKTRIRRFWISVSLAAGALAFPLSNASRGHDLPTRWTSGANSTPSWNYLLDDCLDSPTLPGSQSLTSVDAAARRGTEDWASSCPTEWTAGSDLTAKSSSVDYDGLLRNPISRFSKEMTCWVNEWQMIQHGASRAESAKFAWAKRPDAGNPPAPDYSILHVAKYQAVPLNDTCAFDAEYQARQTAAELLAREIARANEISKNEARVSQALIEAERASAIIEMDSIPAPSAAMTSLVSTGDATDRNLCGGEAQEIMTAQCFPNRFAPGIVDEYIAYDLDMRDQHWLGGLGKSWKLRSALGGAPKTESLIAANDRNANDRNDVAEETDIWAVPVEDGHEAPESFVAPDHVSFNAGADLAAQSAANNDELTAYLDNIVRQAQLSALNLLETARQSSRPIVADIEVMPELLPNLGRSLAMASDWVETQQCQLAAELCGFDGAYQVGAWLGEHSLEATQTLVDSTIELAYHLDLPAVDQPGWMFTSST